MYLFENLKEIASSYLPSEQVEKLRQAYVVARDAHQGQMRSSGEPYITHPVAVARILGDMRLDHETLMAAVLHDVIEDTPVTKDDLAELFGNAVAELVSGVSKLDKLKFRDRKEAQAENFRKMVMAMTQDIRVILIKLADRTHNMRTLGSLRPDKRRRIARETLEIFAPIANRLGIHTMKNELEELGFEALYPMRSRVLRESVRRARGNRREIIDSIESEIEGRLREAGIDAQVSGREKNLFSIYNKMEKKELQFHEVMDIYAFRVRVKDIDTCYRVLGQMHSLYKPRPGRFKDYIAIPKSNGYQSLHTTLVGPSSVSIEFQIRTEEMNIVAEAGVAAHWLYKAQQGHDSEHLSTQWLQSLLDIQNETRDAAEFWDHVKVDLFPDAVYVFTPKSEIMAMPRGATVVDFAYAIHSKIGHRTTAAKINDEEVPLRTELKSGDVVQIITSETSTPNPAWLSFVKTGRARSKIRSYLKNAAQTEAGQLGETLLAQALRAEGIDSVPSQDDANKGVWDEILRITGNRTPADLMVDIGMGRRIASLVAARMTSFMTKQGVRPDALLITQERFNTHNRPFQGAVTLNGDESSSVYYSHCCRPVPGDPILGYLGGQGLVNMAMVTDLFPVVGVPLPFISYGGSSLILNLISASLLLRVSYDNYMAAAKAQDLSAQQARQALRPPFMGH